MIDQSNPPSKTPTSGHPSKNKCLDSKTLLQGEKEIIIMHGDVEYRLRKTAQDKLILTK